MHQRLLAMTAILSALILATPVSAEQLAMGVPQPSLSYSTETPDWPASWPSRSVDDFYYVDNTHPDATDFLNANGTPDKPRLSVPVRTLRAGSYLEIHGGPYETKTIRLVGEGAPDAPVWISGSSDGERPVFRKTLELEGTHVFVEYLIFDRSGNTLALGNDSSNIVIRNNVFSGPRHADGFNSVLSIHGQPDAPVHDIVIVNNEIHGFGDSSPEAQENDYHGIKASRNCSNIWIIQNHTYDMGGDSVQIGDASLPDEERCHHIYIARNQFHQNKENAVDVKKAMDIIVSENSIHSFTPRDSSDASAIVIHNNADNIWIVGNCISDAAIGIINTGAINTWFVANQLTNILAGDELEIDSKYGRGVAMHMRGNSSGGIVDNTLSNYDKGIQLTGGSNYEVSGNAFAGRATVESFDTQIANTGLATRVAQDFNIYEAFSAQISTSRFSSISQYRRSAKKEENGIQATGLVINQTATVFPVRLPEYDQSQQTDSRAYSDFVARYDFSLDASSVDCPRLVGKHSNTDTLAQH